MPWHVDENHSSCPASKPWAVVKDADGSVAGCHPSKAKANDQLAALYASEQSLSDLSDSIAETFDSREERVKMDTMYPPDSESGDAVTIPDTESELIMCLTDKFMDCVLKMHAYELQPDEGKTPAVSDWVAATIVQLTEDIDQLYQFQSDLRDAALQKLMSMTSEDVETLGGKPSPGTPADKRLAANECPDGKRMLNGKCVPKYLAMALDDEEVVDGHPIQPWHGTLVVEGSETGDGREFALESLSWEDPVSSLILLGWQPKDLPQHEEAVTVGRVNHIERIPGPDGSAEIKAWGVIDTGSEFGREVVRQIKGGYAGGLSVDVDSVANVEIVFPEEEPQQALGESDGVAPTFIVGQPEKKVFHQGRIRGVTLCRLPALVEGRLELIDTKEEVLVASSDPLGLTAYEREEVAEPAELVASSASTGIPLNPPAVWFEDPKFDKATPFTITDEGRVFGHMALWSTCHTTFPDRCITPPREKEHAYFLRHALKTAEGRDVQVGSITLGVGHAETALGAVPAAAHYDDPRLAVADVTVGEDRHGIWFAGALRPTISEEQHATLTRGVSLSGDWRGIAGRLRLVAVLCVNSPGFPIPRMRVAAQTEDGPWTTLVAAGVVTDERVAITNGAYPPGTIVIKRRAEEFKGNGNNQYTKGGGGGAPGGGGGDGGKSYGSPRIR